MAWRAGLWPAGRLLHTPGLGAPHQLNPALFSLASEDCNLHILITFTQPLQFGILTIDKS